MIRALALAVVVGALSCGKGSKSAPSPSPTDDAAAPAAAVVADAAPARVRAQPEKSLGYRQALMRGRQASKRADYDGAIAAFEAALAAVPGDARALSELGWVAFKRGDLDRADSATEASIAAAVDPKLRAASLYNRGRIAEERGDSQRAIEAYQRSLELRPNDTVAARLASLGGAVRKALTPTPMAGPHADLAAACKTLPFYTATWTCAAPVIDGPSRLEGQGAIREVRVIGEAARADASGESFDSCRLAVRTDAGWYLGAPITCEKQAWARSTIRSLSWAGHDAGGAPVVEWTLEHATGDRGYDRDGARYQTWVTRVWRLYCSAGASGVPACTPELTLATAEEGDYAYSDVVAYELDAALGEGGTLTIKPISKAVDEDLRPLLGAHVLSFP